MFVVSDLVLISKEETLFRRAQLGLDAGWALEAYPKLILKIFRTL